MKFLRQIIPASGVVMLLLAGVARADVTNAPPEFREVYDLIRAHLAGQSDEQLNEAAVQGLLDQLHAKVSLVSGKSDTGPSLSTQEPLVLKSEVFDGPVAFLRVGHVADGLADKLSASYKSLISTNQLKGLIIDLRYSGGHDYAAAVAAANLFVAREAPLLDWGNGLVQSKANKDAIALPLVVLVNHETANAAEALAAMLRQNAQAVILGSATAGEATIGQNYPLKNGQFLRIASAGIRLGNGDALSTSGVKPDIQVNVKPDDEKAYYADPLKPLVSSGDMADNDSSVGASTNRLTHAHLTEADLIRERKERPGMELDYEEPPGGDDAADADATVVRDPVLARALDLVKGISALRQPRAP